MKISKQRLMEIIKEEMQLEAGGDPVGPVEAKKMAELLQNLGFTLTRGGENSLIDFLQGLEGQGDLSATPDSRRGALAEEGGPTQTPAEQEYDALTTMITRLDGMEGFLLNTTRQKSDEALTQQAAEQLNALRDILSQLRKGL